MIKERIGGKYVRITDANGYYGRNDAGTPMSANPNDAGDKRKKGKPLINQYTFSDTAHGTHTIPAHNFTEALRIAESMGFTRNDYKKR